MQIIGAKPKKPAGGLVGGAAGAAPGPAADIIKDGSLETFAQDVMEASQAVPVLVDFWAPWCGPCKQLTPMLEKLVKQAKGKIRLVKINIDDNPEIAQQLRIQTVPTVYAFLGGQPVTGFQGAQPESQIKTLIERLTGGPLGADSEDLLEEANRALDLGDVRGAANHFGRLLKEDPGNTQAIGGLARCHIAQGKLGEARKLLDGVPQAQEGDASIAGARAALSLAEEAGELPNPRKLEGRLEKDADDHDARADLATVLFLRGQIEAAIDHLCLIVRRDRSWRDDGARKQLVRFFEALGPRHPMTLKGRRKLSTVLFS